MPCKVCGSKTRIVDTRLQGNELRRVRVCDHCNKSFVTYEKYDDTK